MKKTFSIAACVFLSVLFLMGCSAGESPYYNDNASSYGTVSKAAETDLSANRQIIKTARLECSSTDVQKDYQSILSWLKANSGYEFSHEMTTRDGYYTISAVLKIAPEKLDALISVIGENSDIINQSVSANDITEAYYDTELRLKSKKAALEQYYVMLESAATVDEILSIQRVINEYTVEIESLEGKLILWNSQLSEATLTLYFYQTNDPSKPKPVSFGAMSFGDMFGYIGSGVLSVINIIGAVLQWAFIIALSLSPVAVIVFVVLLAIRRARSNKKKK